MTGVPPETSTRRRRISIHTRLRAGVAGYSLLVLLICGASITWSATGYYHEKTRQDLTMLANVFSENLQASLMFNDEQSAFSILSALRQNPHITSAAIYKDGDLFVSYPEDMTDEGHAALPADEGVWLRGDRYFAAVPIRMPGQSEGRLVLVSDLTEWKRRQAGLYLLFAGLFCGLLLLTLLFSAWLKKHISEPLAALSAWATGVSREKNFDARAEKRSDDEIGVLVDSLNGMLSELARQKSIVSWNQQLKMEIEERKKIEKELIEMRDRAEAASSAKSRFLANMSHEIRTPMNAIIGFVDVVLDSPLTDEQKKRLETVKRSARSLHSLLNDILDVAKLEQEKIELETIPFSAHQLVDDVIAMFEVSAKEKNIRLIRDISPEVPSALVGDPFRLNQILTNLVANAIKFTPEGSVRIVLEKKDGQFLKFSVIDTGIGIPEDKHHQIFKSFAQADSSTTRRFGGTGLGTAISRQLVELMGGEIWFESRENKGSTFSFTVRINLAEVKELPQPVPRKTENRLELKTSRPLRILVAEDISENAELLKVRLGGMGHALIHASNGREALKFFEQQDFDIILMDVHMPEVDGLAAARAIRATDRGGKLPILALTASVLREDQEECYAAGMNGFVTKPIVFEELFAEMARLLGLDRPAGSAAEGGAEPLGGVAAGPGINLEKAIRNWGSEEDYFNTLKNFFGRHQDDISRIRDSLKSDAEGARQLVHALKGVAGNLSLDSLFMKLESLGLAIRQRREEEYDALLDEVSGAMRQARDSAARLLDRSVAGKRSGAPADRRRLVGNLDRLAQSLSRGSIDDDLYSDVMQGLKNSGVRKELLDRIASALESFEFERACALLEEARAQIAV